MNSTIHSIGEVAQRQLCTGCGVCAFIEPERFRMVDVLEYGRRPLVRDNAPAESGKALLVCPGISLEHTFDPSHPDIIRDLTDAWGPVIEVWEGFATDDEIRFAGSSGGRQLHWHFIALKRVAWVACCMRRRERTLRT